MSKARAKIDRVIAALEHREPDRVPAGEFFWTSFLRRARREHDLPAAFDPYRHWDLDMVVINPNMDPRLTGIRVIEQREDVRVVQTGFGATIEVHESCPMPMYREFTTRSYEQIRDFTFDDPRDDRRFTGNLSDQINSVGDALNLEVPPFVDRVNAYADDFCVFGSVCEPHEMLWRIVGTENALIKLAEEPLEMARFIERLGDFLVGIAEAQIAAARGRLSGLYIWGDIAYVKGMFFSPDYWRSVYKPQLKRICDVARAAGLKTIYHGCGNATKVFDDMIEAGIDGYNPLEAKAHLNVVDLKSKYAGRLAFNGNLDVRVLATNDREQIRREVLTKLNAARGGGYIAQSDHSVPGDVNFDSYDYAIGLVREYGRYPLRLAEYDLENLNG
jgi:hypothetical protein